MQLKLITAEMIRGWGRNDATTSMIADDWTGTVLDILDSEIGAEDKEWLVLREELLPKWLLLEFARWCALRVIHLCNATPVMKEYLESGDENLQVEAWVAAKIAAKRAVMDTDGFAAWYAARAVVGATARAGAGFGAAAAAVYAADAEAEALDVALDAVFDLQIAKLRELIEAVQQVET